jgi:hypothetical protein
MDASFALLLVRGEGLIQRSGAGEALRCGGRQQFGVAQSIGHAQSHKRILVIAGVAHQGPAGTVRPAEEIRQVRGAVEAFLAAAAAHPCGELRLQIQRSEKALLDIRLYLGKLVDRPSNEDRGQVVVRGETKMARRFLM